MNGKLQCSTHSIDAGKEVQTPSRRTFIRKMLGGTAVFAAAPYISCGRAADSLESLKEAASGLQGTAIGDEQFWRTVKAQFIIRDNLIMINAANLAPSPLPVMETLFKYTRDINQDAAPQNRVKYSDMHEKTRKALAGYIGADPEEIAIVRNTSEANNVVINGLTLTKGDEVVIWDQNHPTNNVAWDVRAERYGYTVKRVSTPPEPQTPKDLIKPFYDQFTRRTKVLAFSDISNVSGVYLPVKELCTLARNAGIFTLVDGAQSVGAVAVNMHERGCDFYTASSHKWMVGPREAGILYVRKERIADVWPSVVGVGWSGALSSGTAKKFETLGQQDYARIAAFGTTVEFLNAIGKKRIETRMYALSGALMHGLERRIPGITFYAPHKQELRGGIVKFIVPENVLSNAGSILYKQHNIGCAVHGGAELPGIRLSPHLYNTMEEIEKTADAVARLVG